MDVDDEEIANDRFPCLEALKTMREADTVKWNEVAVLNSIENNTGASSMENDMIDGESGAL